MGSSPTGRINCDEGKMKWTRKNNEEQMTYQTAEKNNISCAYQIRKTKKIYEIFQECTPEGKTLTGNSFPNAHKWYYLTNFKSLKKAKDFVDAFHSGTMTLTEYEREPVPVNKDKDNTNA